jgi:hypothetical protein
MSTRGTYQIRMEYTEKDGKILTHENRCVCIYSQNDNYPSGAVYKFKNTLELQKDLKERLNNTSFIECFIAANIREFGYMEITSNHDNHYDTDYAYDITISDDIYLKCYKYIGWGNILTTIRKRDKELYYDGLLMDFINNTAIELLDK